MLWSDETKIVFIGSKHLKKVCQETKHEFVEKHLIPTICWVILGRRGVMILSVFFAFNGSRNFVRAATLYQASYKTI